MKYYSNGTRDVLVIIYDCTLFFYEFQILVMLNGAFLHGIGFKRPFKILIAKPGLESKFFYGIMRHTLNQIVQTRTLNVVFTV